MAMAKVANDEPSCVKPVASNFLSTSQHSLGAKIYLYIGTAFLEMESFCKKKDHIIAANGA